MKVERLNVDFGNSTSNFLSDSYYFEIPTCVVEITKEQSEELFTNTVDDTTDLLNRLVISIDYNNEEKYYMVGRLAESSPFAHSHVGKMHDKINSDIPYATFLAAMLYVYKINGEHSDATVDIENMKMMLPIWLLKKEDKFSVAQHKMINRFNGQHSVKLLTPGMETELNINVNSAKCYIESEVSRWALKYKITNSGGSENSVVIEKRNEMKKFDNYETVLIDIGGGSTDAVRLTKGLNTPISAESFQVIQIDPFLGRLEKLLKEKLIEYFPTLRSLEKFIVDNYTEQLYLYRNLNTGERVDLTDPITDMLREYANVLVYKTLESFKGNNGEVLKFIYLGGETPILEPYIKRAVSRNTNQLIMETNHFFLNDLLDDSENEVLRPAARTINLVALEILSLNEKTK